MLFQPAGHLLGNALDAAVRKGVFQPALPLGKNLGIVGLQDADVWGKTLNETFTSFNNMMELYFEDFDIDGLLAKYESGKYSVRYATELTELAGRQKLVRLYDPSGNLIEVRTPFKCN